METKDMYYSDFLFSTSSYLTGAGTVLNIAGNFYKFNYSSSDLEADAKAIKCDFGVVGEEMSKASRELVVGNNGLLK